jgi:hydrogenase maturation factor HypE
LPEFTWGLLAGATSYDIEIAFDSDFTNIFHYATGIRSLSYLMPIALEGGTRYFWRVRGNS